MELGTLSSLEDTWLEIAGHAGRIVIHLIVATGSLQSTAPQRLHRTVETCVVQEVDGAVDLCAARTEAIVSSPFSQREIELNSASDK